MIGADGSTILPGFTEGVDQNVLTADEYPTVTSSDLPEPASMYGAGVRLDGIVGGPAAAQVALFANTELTEDRVEDILDADVAGD